MKRRIIPVILALIVISAFLPLNAGAVTSAGTQAVLEKYFEKGGELKLTAAINLTKGLVVPEGITVSLDLNGKTLNRGLSVCVENGSVITVMPGATFTLRDTSGNNDGIIKGGAAFNGGGICNYGNTTIEGGTIYGNKATDNTYGCGGGIYNGSKDSSSGTLTVKGGVLLHNRSRNGSGIYNASGCTVTIEEGSYIKSVGNIKKTIIDNVKITENSATGLGGGIFNAGTVNLSGSPDISGNLADDAADDIYSAAGKYITASGKITCKNKTALSGEGSDPVAVKNYNSTNTAPVKDNFYAANQEESVILGNSGDIIIKNTSVSVVQVFSGSKLVKTEEHATADAAWNAATTYSSSYTRVELVLGSNYEHDKQLIILNGKNLTLDLNGHYVKRTRNGQQIDDGEVFYVGDGATFTVTDSNPESKGYDGIFGGVITGGASENGAGGVHVRPGATFNMYGGTIYKCTSDEHGGAILLKDGSKLNMKDCRIYFCQTIDSADSSHGGGIAVRKAGCTINLENVIFQDCYSEDSGGALYLYNEGQELNCLVKNCLFVGNITEDWGGAVNLFSTDEKFHVKFDGCIFRNNRAGDNGGAIAVSGLNSQAKQPPMLVENCQFYDNYAGQYGAAVEVSRPGTVLMDCTVTGNYSKRSGAVHVNEKYVISLAGKMIIKDNRSDNRGANLDLDDTNDTTKDTTFESAGLCEGSEVYYYRGDRDGVPVAKHITQYQTKFFIPEHGTAEFISSKEISTPVVTASVFSSPTAITIIGLSAAGAAAIIIAVIYKKKKGGACANETD